MSNAALLKVIKTITMETQEASRPVKLMFGKVISEKPLKILVEQKKILTEDFLILTRNVTEYEFDMTVDHVTEDTTEPMTAKMAGGGKDPSFTAHQHKHSHTHPYKGKKRFLVHNALRMDEIVAILQMQGGQKYLVIDRVDGGAIL